MNTFVSAILTNPPNQTRLHTALLLPLLVGLGVLLVEHSLLVPQLLDPILVRALLQGLVRVGLLDRLLNPSPQRVQEINHFLPHIRVLEVLLLSQIAQGLDK